MREHLHQLVNGLPRSWRAATIVGFVALALATALAGCGSSPTGSTNPTATTAPAPTATTAPTTAPTATTGGQSGGGSAAVSIFSFGFNPATITVKVGTTVTWTNTASIAHTTTSDSGDAVSWDSSAMNPNTTFKFTFTKAGTYTYHCAIHPEMMGKIIVIA